MVKMPAKQDGTTQDAKKEEDGQDIWQLRSFKTMTPFDFL